MNTHRRPADGFTLLEIVIVIAVLAILATAITPMILQQVMDAKVQTTRNEAKVLHEAIVGRSDVKGSFGFVGDLGHFPASFKELVKPAPEMPLFNNVTVRGVGMGWKGPYINTGDAKDDYLVDAYGRAYTGAETGQIRSAGPDGEFGTTDDIVYPPNPPSVYGRLQVTIKRMAAEDNMSWTVDPTPSYVVRLYYTDNGAQAYLEDRFPPFVFENVTQGVHAMQVIRRKPEKLDQIVGQDTIEIYPGATRVVEVVFRL
jgi:prepilin-type N-terminal cleavage/methylation domain-containing protein